MRGRITARRRAGADTAKAGAARYRLEAQIGFRLRKAHQRASEIFHQVMSEFDVTPMQFAVLVKLDELGAVSQNQLGRHVAMDPATTYGVVGRLIRRQLVEQHASPADARLSMIGLTDAGRAMVASMKQKGPEVSACTLSPLDDHEQRLLLDLLTRIG